MARTSASRALLLGERISRQGLVGRGSASVAAAAAVTTAIQAQDPPASRLGLRSRAAAITEGEVSDAITDSRTVVRTWLMRGTIHLVDTADLRWLVRVIGPSLIARQRPRWPRLGLDEAVLQRCVDALPEILVGAPLTRAELQAALVARGLPVDADQPQATNHVASYASALGVICRGPDHGRLGRFTMLDSWVPGSPAGPSGDDALAELARRYFAAFSPATATDFGAWSGLPHSRAVGLIRDELTAVDVDGRPGFRLGAVEPARGVALLPAFDNYLVGYRDREAMLTEALRPLVYHGGMIYPSVVRDGRVVGTWRLDRTRDPAVVTVEPFATLPRVVLRGVESEVADIARFLARDVVLAVGAALDPP